MPTTLVRKRKAVVKPQTEIAGDPDLRRYIYCIIDCDEPKNFDCDAIGDSCRDVYAVPYKGIAAVVSRSPKEKYAIDRQNALAHQRVMEYVMQQGHTVLPVKFDTIAEAQNGIGPEQRIIEQVLTKNFHEFSSLLSVMSTRAEMGLKALWKDMRTVFREIVNSSEEIRRLRDKIAGHGGATAKIAHQQGGKRGPQIPTRMKLGELVKKALDAKMEREQRALLDAMRDIVVDFRKNKTFGDQMFANLALLLEKSRMEDLDSKVGQLADSGPERIKLKYVGPVPPCNFIELMITWEE